MALAQDSYMSHAFPADELRPLSCDGRLRRERGDLDAMLGNYSMSYGLQFQRGLGGVSAGATGKYFSSKDAY